MKHPLLPMFVILLACEASASSDTAGTTVQPPEAPQMAGTLVAEQTIQVGSKVSVEGASPSTHFAVVFEDDGDTGYLYGLDLLKEDNPIVDALHIYDVQAVTDRALPSTIRIIWSVDGLKAALLINGYPHAVFDFADKRGYCRSGFPPPDRSWTQHGHAWSDDAIELFR